MNFSLNLCPAGQSDLNVALIGFGAIGQRLSTLLQLHAPTTRICAVLEREDRMASVLDRLPPGAMPAHALQDLLDAQPDLVIECAGHAALMSFGVPVLEAGVDLLIASVGALADEPTETALRAAAKSGRSCLRVPCGALGGLDVLASAGLSGLDRVVYSSNKAPLAWRGTPAETMIDLDAVREPQAFFVGHAREAARLFPQNANVAAAVALAGVGFERTEVRLCADPTAQGNHHRIEASGAFGAINVSVLGKTLPDNPKTSQLAPMSLVRSVLSLSQSLVVG